MAKPRVLVTRPVQQKALEEIAKHCVISSYAVDEPMPEGVLRDAIKEVEAVMPCGMRLSGETIAVAPRLRVVANIGAGYDNIDIDACSRRGILVTNTPDVLSESTADLAFALLLSTARRVVEGDRFVREGKWRRWEWNAHWGAELSGKTIGLYGCGRIGQAVARRARGFSMRVIYHTRNRLCLDVERELRAELVNFPTLLRKSDFLSIHVPSTPETRRSIGASELAQMKPSAFLINTGRGNLVDEAALVKALQGGQLRGAGLDVFENEPAVHSQLLEMNNVVLLPHIGSATEETRLNMVLLAATNLIQALEGKRPQNLVNAEVWNSARG
jgi:glyoxylate reductase